MEKEFIPYEQALALKELGFNEKCLSHYTSFGYYNDKQELKWRRPIFSLINGVEISNKDLTWQEDETVILKQVTPPLYQQAFRWFREKYDLHSHIRESLSFDKILEFVSQINGSYVTHNDFDKHINRFETYEEAELECLKKLIEIVKNK